MIKAFDAEGIYFRLYKTEFVIESFSGILYFAELDEDNIWKSAEGFYYQSFTDLWDDVKGWISEIASTMWSESKYEEFFCAVDALFTNVINQPRRGRL